METIGMERPNSSALLEMRGITKSFAGNMVLNKVNFQCRGGEIHGLIGENGAGKSTLMKILAGVYSLDEGEIEVDGRAVAFAGYDQARRAGIRIVYQELSLLPGLSVAENILMGRWTRGRGGLISWRGMNEMAREALERVGLGDLNPARLTGPLPIATRQLIEVAKALLHDPRIVVFDEPTSSLTEKEAARLFSLIHELKDQGKGIVFISHRLREVLDHCDRITVMKDAEKVLTDDASAFDENRLIVAMIGRELSAIYPGKRDSPPGREIFSYRGRPDGAGDELSFSVREGEVLGVGGLAGQGQIPMLESIFGLGKADGVTVTVAGEKYTIKKPGDAIRAGIALIPEDRNKQAAFHILSIMENIAASSLDRHSWFWLIKRISEFKAVRGVAERLKVRMTSLAQEVAYLSGGNIQKTIFARWLLASPRVMVLLSPTNGIDIGTKQQIYGLMRELAGKGIAIIVLTGDMMELIGLCDRVLVMYDNAIVRELAGPEITEENIMETSVRRRIRD
ncbi:MAG: sugar ABC transporter ATP-binding protein [Planctomycetota bacterium]|jgi:ribose transport system ATP-binding protein|nr:sugar ABC transporter ATP-binding protein [Planctomycetota bacterium]